MGKQCRRSRSPRKELRPLHYTKLGKHTVNAVRLAEVLQVLARHGFADLMRRAGFFDSLPARMLRGLKLMDAPTGIQASFGKRLCAAFTQLGPTYVKFGQILSTRPDLVTPEVAQDLSQLQDEVDTLPFDTMRGVLEEELGGAVEEFFDTLEPTPIASASISQVYRARLRDGQDVAVKIMRPGIEKVIESDLSLMRQLASWAGDHTEDMKWLDPAGMVDEFARSVHRELDLNIEARVIERFRENMADIEEVFVPRVYREHSGRHVLTMDWVDGVRVDKLDAYAERRCEPDVIAALGCDILCRMVFENRLFHADPHPGNIFITYDNQLAFLDLGMAGHLERTDVAAIADVLLAIFHQDSRECTNAILTLTTRSEPEDMAKLEREIAEFMAFEAGAIVGGGQVAKGIERATQIIRRFDLELAPRFSLLLKALTTIEIVGHQLNPKLDMVPIIRPYVEKLIAARFQPVELLKEARVNANALMKLGRQMPGDLSYLLKQLRRGNMRFMIHHEHLENLAKTIDRSSSRNTVGMIVGSLIVGSSLLITTESSMTHLGMAGYVFAALLGSFLVISILWSRKF